MKGIESMKAWVFYGKKDLRFEDYQIENLKSDEVRIKIFRSGLCSADVEEYFEGPIFKNHLPMIIGHEFGGEVIEVGEEVSKEWIGKMVTVLPLVSCGKCEYCLNSMENLCPSLGYYGLLRYNGGMAEYANVKVENIIPVSKIEEVNFGEIVASSLEAIEKLRRIASRDLKDMKILIIGAGIVGIITALLLKLDDAKVVIHERGKNRSKMAETLGFETAKDPMDIPNEFFDVIFDCAGQDVIYPAALLTGMEKIKPGGIIMLMGMYESKMFEFRWDNLLKNEVKLIPSIFYRKRVVGIVKKQMEKISDYFPDFVKLIRPDELKVYIENYSLKKDEYLRVVVEWGKAGKS